MWKDSHLHILEALQKLTVDMIQDAGIDASGSELAIEASELAMEANELLARTQFAVMEDLEHRRLALQFAEALRGFAQREV
jgi:hypothetical protein